MIIRDLSVFSIFKFLLAVQAIPIILVSPILLFFRIFKPEALTRRGVFENSSASFLDLGFFTIDIFTISNSFWLALLVTAVNGLILFWVQALLLRVFAKYTPLGNIKLASRPDRLQVTFD